jgi:hypothetical protein
MEPASFAAIIFQRKLELNGRDTNSKDTVGRAEDVDEISTKTVGHDSYRA